jgi:hypothetical protein
VLIPLIISFIVLLVILVAAFAGLAARQRLSPQHLSDESKTSVSMAVVATLSALVLGLLISNANTSFTAVGGQVTAMSAQILRLDQILGWYGPETAHARELLRHYAELKSVDLFPDNPADVRLNDESTYKALLQLEDALFALKPANARDQWLIGQATALAGKIGDTRWLLAQQVGQGTPREFVALLVFWLALLFATFGLFAPPNLLTAASLTLCAVAVAGAIGMVLELEKGFGGLISVSPQPMHQAIAQLRLESSGSASPGGQAESH